MARRDLRQHGQGPRVHPQRPRIRLGLPRRHVQVRQQRVLQLRGEQPVREHVVREAGEHRRELGVERGQVVLELEGGAVGVPVQILGPDSNEKKLFDFRLEKWLEFLA